MIGLAFVVAGVSLAIGFGVAYALRFVPTVKLQLAGLALVSVCVPLGAVLASGWVMFHMGSDRKVLAVAAGSATAAVVAGLLLSRWTSQSLRRVSDASAQLAAGDLSARAPTGGPSEIAKLAEGFNAMAASIEQLFDARRELVAWASHDLRTPLASMQAMIEAIEDGLATPEDYLPTLREQVRTLTLLVDDLFELARIDAGALTLELQQLPVANLVDSTIRLLRPEAVARNVDLVVHADGETTAPVAPGEDRARAVQPGHERTPPHAVGRLRRRQRRPERRGRARLGRGHGHRPRAGGAGPDVRALLARRPRPLRRRDGPRASRSPAASSRPTAARSGPRTEPREGRRVSFTLPAART